MIGQIFQSIGLVITQMFQVLGNGITEATKIFYLEETGFTFLGTLALITAGVGLVYWTFHLIRSFLNIGVK